jgi:hypothetical protein
MNGLKRLTVTVFLVLTAVLTLTVDPVTASVGQAGTPATPLCLPGPVSDTDQGCQIRGPAAYLHQQAAEGIILPRVPLPAHPLESAFSELPYNYVRLYDGETPIFSDLTQAMKNENPYRVIPPGFNFVSYVDYYQGAGNGRHYMIEPGMWIRGGHTNGGVSPSNFNGMIFAGTPDREFGWVIYQTESQSAPGGDGELTGNVLQKFDVIQVYQKMEAAGTTWLLIGPDEWIDKTKTALVYPAEQPPAGVDNGRWIEVNLYEQTISAYQQNRLVFATVTSTGIPGWWTRPGLFQVYEKLESTPMSGAFEADRSDYYYLEDVPWTMYFDEARALHGAYWHNYFGYEQSHGCVNLSPGDSHWLYLWANIGDFVYVWDPSGQTPTDPSLYTAGGA